MSLNVGDRIVVVNSLMGIYNDKKGVIRRIVDSDYVEVVLDINRGTISEVTLLPIVAIESIKVDQETSSLKQVTSVDVKRDCESIDDRLDNVEILLNKYNLSIKDGCGFMYIYDFLDTLGLNWNLISSEDREIIAYCLLGEKFKLN